MISSCLGALATDAEIATAIRQQRVPVVHERQVRPAELAKALDLLKYASDRQAVLRDLAEHDPATRDALSDALYNAQFIIAASRKEDCFLVFMKRSYSVRLRVLEGSNVNLALVEF